MLLYIVLFLIIGFLIGLFIKNDKSSFTLVLIISVLWFFPFGIWAILTFIELLIGIEIGKKIKISKNNIPTNNQNMFTNSIGMEFVLIPAGSFIRTTDFIGNKLNKNELIVIEKPFYLGVYPVTQKQWTDIMGNLYTDISRIKWIAENTTLLADEYDCWQMWKNANGYANPSKYIGNDLPVESVPWKDAQEFIRRLNKKEHTNRYRLPTAMEWELAVRGKDGQDNILIDNEEEDIDILSKYSHIPEENFDDTTHIVGQKKPNSFGLYDLIGNVQEWMEDHNDKMVDLFDRPVYSNYSKQDTYISRGGNLANTIKGIYGFKTLNGFRIAVSID